MILFGSSLDATPEANDIDLGVKGLDPRLLFGFLGELLMRLSKPVDLVDLTRRDLFNELMEKRGSPLLYSAPIRRPSPSADRRIAVAERGRGG